MQLLTALSLFIPYLLGLGLFSSLVAPRLMGDLPQTPHDCGRLLTILFLSGTSLNYLFVIMLQGLGISIITGSIFSVIGLLYSLYRTRLQLYTIFKLGWIRWFSVSYLLLLCAIPILLSPLIAWDAWFIWFFHGKIIYFNKDGFDLTNIAKEMQIYVAHPDYPKLLAVLAAQFAHVAGYWNELFPKASLLVLLIPVICGIFSVTRKLHLSILYFIIFCIFSCDNSLWNGYLDGYLALYGALTLLFWGRWLTSHQALDFIAGALFLFIAASLKNEGMLLVISATCSLALISLFTQKWKNQLRYFYQTIPFLSLVLIPILCQIAWTLRKSKWGFINDLKLGIGSLPRIIERIVEGEWMVIGHNLLIDQSVGRAILICLCGLALAKMQRINLSADFWFAVLNAFIYFTGMFIVYLATPHELIGHLDTSASRTMLTVVLSLITATYFVLRRFESNEPDVEISDWDETQICSKKIATK